MINLDSLSFDELIDLREKLEDAINARKNTEADALLTLFQQRAEAIGVSLEELVGKMGKKGRAKRAKTSQGAKYANPSNRAETWTGKGRKPQWFIDATTKHGKSAEDLLL